CAWCRRYSAMPTFPPRRSTRTCWRSGSRAWCETCIRWGRVEPNPPSATGLYDRVICVACTCRNLAEGIDIAGSTKLTVRLYPQVKKRLGRLAVESKRTKSYVAAEAIADFVDRE